MKCWRSGNLLPSTFDRSRYASCSRLVAPSVTFHPWRDSSRRAMRCSWAYRAVNRASEAPGSLRSAASISAESDASTGRSEGECSSPWRRRWRDPGGVDDSPSRSHWRDYDERTIRSDDDRHGTTTQPATRHGVEHGRQGLQPDQPRHRRLDRALRAAARSAARRADPRPVDRHRLDVAAGGPARRHGRSASTSPAGSLDAARAQAEVEGLAIDYQIGDAEQLPFEDAAFDAVVSTCGVMFASRPEAAAAELARVCRPGGRIALTTWLSDGNLFKMFQVMRAYMPPPPSPPPPSPFEWGRTERIQRAARRGLRPEVREGRVLLSRAERRGGVAHLLDRLRSDAGAGRQPRRREARRLRARLRRLPRRLPHRARHLRAARLLAHVGRRR